MTTIIEVPNVNYALQEGLRHLLGKGVTDQSRNGPVIVSPGPVITEYAHPDQRVLFSALRDANPFFHLMESLWMLAGRNDVAFVKYYASGMDAFSDDAKTLHGAYGYRWRESMGYDQLPIIIKELTANPQSRRCVLQMWECTSSEHGWNGEEVVGMDDLHKAMSGGKDVPCNTHVYFDARDGVMNMTVCCRSNDVVWGAYGANVVHFSMLMEYVARGAGLKLGVYRQFSNNYHVYSERPDVKKLLASLQVMDGGRDDFDDFYTSKDCLPYPIMLAGQWELFDADCEFFFGMWGEGRLMDGSAYHGPFWYDVVVPIVNAHHAYKSNDFTAAYEHLARCQAGDWYLACVEWLERRQQARLAREPGNV